MRRSLVIVAAAVAGTLVLGAGESSPTTTGPRGGTLRVVLPSQATPTLDPAVGAGPTTGWGALWYSICATLYAFRDAPAPAGYELRAEAAEGPPAVSNDRRTYVFTVRRGLRFSDGSPLTAANFEHGLRRVLSPGTRSEGAFLFSDVKRVSASGRRLRIELRQPRGDLLTRLALAYSCPVPLGLPVDAGGVQLLAGSGPYYIARAESGRLLVLQRNPHYRGTRPRWADRVTIEIGGDIDATLKAVEEGRADVHAAELPFEVRDPLAGRYGVNRGRLFRIYGVVDYFLALNTSRPLFRGNVALRKAVNLALDRTAIAKAGPGWPRSHQPTDQILPHWMPGWSDERIYPLGGPNLQRARSHAAGNLRGGKAVLYTSQVPFLVDQANLIARQLSQIGLDVTVTPLAPAVLDARAGTPGAPYDMVLTRYFVQYPDPADPMVRLLGGAQARQPVGNTNHAYFDSPVYDRRMAAANRLSGAARQKAFSELDATLMRDAAPWAPLYEGSTWLFLSNRVGCLKLHPVFRMDLAAMCVR